MFFSYEKDDPKNIKRARNMNNTSSSQYNCGGFALGIFSWYTPFNEITDIELERPEDYSEIEEIAIDNILADFPDLEPVSSTRVYNMEIDYHTNEIIAFRFSSFDFHFWKLEADGKWYDKMGGSYFINDHTYYDVFDNWGAYDGTIYFFTRKRA